MLLYTNLKRLDEKLRLINECETVLEKQLMTLLLFGVDASNCETLDDFSQLAFETEQKEFFQR